MSGALGIVAFVVLILFAIGFHEFGHFITARWAGIKVSRFFIGFGPTLWSIRRGREEMLVNADGTTIARPETEYGVKLLPLGGFVKVVGMSPFEEVPEADQPRSFTAAPAWKRAVVLAAGSFTHFLTAFVLLVVMFGLVGVPDIERPTLEVEAVSTEIDGAPSPAAAAGIERGDVIVSADGVALTDFDALRTYVSARPDRRISLVVRRDGTNRTVDITPVPFQGADGVRGLIGVGPAYAIDRANPLVAVGRAGQEMGSLFTRVFTGLPDAFSPSRLGIGSDGPTDDRAISIVGAGKIAGDLASSGQLLLYLFLFISINVFIGVLNLLPIPPLDGGHLLFLGLERLRGRPVREGTMVGVTYAFMSLFILLSVLLVYLDVTTPPQLPGN